MRARISSINVRKQLAYISGSPSEVHIHASQLQDVPFTFDLVGREVEYEVAPGAVGIAHATSARLLPEPTITSEAKE